jgi:hypothetical protein
MKRIERNEVLGLADYETIRDRFRTRVVSDKKRRRVQLGPNVTVLFENRDTVLLQIQEMLRTERITRPGAIQHEIDTYNDSVPGDDELSCTLMIAIVDAVERETFLQAAVGFEDCVSLVVQEQRIPARSAARDGATTERTTAVHYVKFALPRPIADRIRAVPAVDTAAAPVRVELRVDHPSYTAGIVLPPETLLELAEDLRE